jgi:hypothetical protein
MPVEKVADVTLRPIAIARRARLAAGEQVGAVLFFHALAGRDLGDDAVGAFGVAAGMAVAAPFDVQHAVHRPSNDTLLLSTEYAAHRVIRK